ncbi:hypothetical protein LR948_00170 [Roseivivax sp. GX 12232]|uniref:hypothetical protein n=1 Tax=Roseivivax sp. GX 12232 TaxID=2900547 RepID=UPI001E4BC91E|nr:hypothetical protein [Roseivivax sp. GX 12232]MCE0503758.1 hypothetical protein [Roseivivax sp. GX 12232]
MKPEFALNLSFDGITLLRRVRGGWAILGEAALDGDMAREMAWLREAAAAAPHGTEVKLILPEDQIKFLDREAGGAPETAARAALEGATPYPVAELRIDAEETGGRLHVAAVAEETLAEAEAFALEHGFQPVGFVAAKGNGFGREVVFGPAQSWTGKALTPESAGLKIVPMPEGVEASGAATAEAKADAAAGVSDVEAAADASADAEAAPDAAAGEADAAPSQSHADAAQDDALAPEIPEQAPIAEAAASEEFEDTPEAAENDQPIDEPEAATGDALASDSPEDVPEAALAKTSDVEPTPARPVSADQESAAEPEPEVSPAPTPAPSEAETKAKEAPEPAQASFAFQSTRSREEAGESPRAPLRANPEDRPAGRLSLSKTPKRKAPAAPKKPAAKKASEGPATPAPDLEASLSRPDPAPPRRSERRSDATPPLRAERPSDATPRDPAEPGSEAKPARASRAAPVPPARPGRSAEPGPQLSKPSGQAPAPRAGAGDDIPPAPRRSGAEAQPPRPEAQAEPPVAPLRPAAAAQGEGRRDTAPQAPQRPQGRAPQAEDHPAERPPLSARDRIAALRPGTEAPAGTAVDTPALAAGLAAFSGSRRDDPAEAPGPEAAQNLPRGTRPGVGSFFARKPRIDPEKAAEEERMTVFGARRKDGYVGGKPRYLGLMLTSALLVFLLGVAAWASVFLEDGIARFFRETPESAVASLTPSEDLPALPLETSARPAARPAPAPEADPVREARLETGAETDAARSPAPESPETSEETGEETAPEAPAALPEAPAEAPPRLLSPEEAEATYAATGIWQRAPGAPAEIAGEESGDPYVASIDPEVPQFDATALPEVAAAPDSAPASLPIPAPAGTPFDLDDRGLVRATPEGAVNPDRVRIFAGLPPAVPPRRGAALAPLMEAIPERGDGSRPAPTEIFNRVQESSGLRPSARPEDLQEQNDRANLAGFSRSELAAFRPELRPENAKDELEADRSATAQAVETSNRPSGRPGNIAAIVAAVEASRAAAPAPAQAQQVAQAAPRTVAPSVPSNTSVSRAATEENALNLRRINLIGVYGNESNRQALVRLGNGRYVKVGVGDRLDGGRVSAIGESQLRYVKGGRNMTLEMPRG